MKRNQAISIIYDQLCKNIEYEGQVPIWLESLASDILYDLENAGMLPPKTKNPIIPYTNPWEYAIDLAKASEHGYNFKYSNEPYYVNQWDYENENT